MNSSDDHGTPPTPGRPPIPDVLPPREPGSAAPASTVTGAEAANGNGQLTLKVSGAWNGDVSDPKREFHGQVTESSHAALPGGTPVTVTFQGADTRVAEAKVHGTYTLSANGKQWKLMRLSLPPSRAGGQVQDDTQTAEWEAVLIDT